MLYSYKTVILNSNNILQYYCFTVFQFLAQTERFVSLDLNVSSQAAGFNLVLSLYTFFSLKAASPIDCNQMTDRLQWFELKHMCLCST